jgi:hypothetical protein
MHICILTHQEAVEGGIALSGKGLVCHISGFQCDRQGWGRSNLLLLLDLRGRGSVRCTLVATSRNVSKPFLPREVLQIVLDVIESQPQNLWNAEGGDGGESHDTGAEADCRGEPSVRRQVAKGKGGEERAALAGSGGDTVSRATDTSGEDFDGDKEGHVVGATLQEDRRDDEDGHETSGTGGLLDACPNSVQDRADEATTDETHAAT